MRGAAVIGAVIAAAAALGGCSETDRVAETEEALAAVLGERLGSVAGSVAVSCPDDAVLEAGATLECQVAVGDDDPLAVAFLIGESGSVSPAVAIIPTDAVERYLGGELATAAASGVTADCGDATLLVRDIGGTFVCNVVRSSDGVAFDVTVEVRSLDGSVTYSVATTTTTTVPVPPAVDPAATTTPP